MRSSTPRSEVVFAVDGAGEELEPEAATDGSKWTPDEHPTSNIQRPTSKWTQFAGELEANPEFSR